MVTQRVTCDLAGRLVLLDEEPVLGQFIIHELDTGGSLVPGAFYSWGEVIKDIFERGLDRVIPITDKSTADRCVAHMNGYFTDNGLDYMFIGDSLNMRIVSDREIVAKNKDKFGIAMRTGYILSTDGDAINALRRRGVRLYKKLHTKIIKELTPGTSEAYGKEAAKIKALIKMVEANDELILLSFEPDKPPPPRKKF